jgi:acyl-CoA dehydrogenase
MKPIDNIHELVAILNKKSISSLGCVIALHIDEHVLILDGHQGKVIEGSASSDCQVITTLSDISDIISGKLDPTTAFMLGKIKVQGDLSKAMKLQTLLT